MRSAIRQILIDNITAVQGRVYEPHAAGPNTQKPYLVLREGVQDPEADVQIPLWSILTNFNVLNQYLKVRSNSSMVDPDNYGIFDRVHFEKFKFLYGRS